MKTPHPLKEIINAIADGIEVEISCKGHLDWIMWNKDMISPLDSKAFYYEYRIKPEPKPDVVRYGVAFVESKPNSFGGIKHFGDANLNPVNNLKLTFDGAPL